MPAYFTTFKRLTILVLLLLYGFNASAQLPETLTEKYAKISFLPKSNLFYAIDALTHPDTIPDRFWIYHPLFRNEIAFIDQGNIVSAYQPLIFSAERPTGLDFGMQDKFGRYLFQNENPRMYKTRTPYTDLFYTQGANELINIKALHTQNIKPNWNIGIDFNRTKSDGFQLRQRTSVYNTRVFSWYHTKDERYHLILAATFNRLRNEENGGIVSDSLFESNKAIRQVAVRLGDAADAVRSYIKTTDYRVTNMFRLGPQRQLKYTLPGDSTYQQDSNKVFIPSYVISHEASYTGNRYVFKDNSYDTGSYYPFTFLNKERTNDSIQHRVLGTSVTIATGPFMSFVRDGIPIKRLLMFSATAGYQYHQLNYFDSTNANYTNTYVGGSIISNPFTKVPVTFNAEGTFWLTGYNQADYKVKGGLGIAIGNIEFKANALFQAYEPQYTQFFFFGNHNYWKYNFDKTFANSVSAGLSTRHLKHNYHLTVTQQLVNNYIYFDTAFIARQEAKAISITSVNFRKVFAFGNFRLANNITAQVTNNTDIIRIPRLATWNSFYFEGHLFKKAMYTQIGVDFFYYSDVRANTYDPETRQFYLQNQVQTGSYPLFDFFITGHVRTFSFFAKMEHLNMGFSGDRYYAAPHYPMPTRAFRLGIGWKFFD